jgi:hypothetical protein
MRETCLHRNVASSWVDFPRRTCHDGRDASPRIEEEADPNSTKRMSRQVLRQQESEKGAIKVGSQIDLFATGRSRHGKDRRASGRRSVIGAGTGSGIRSIWSHGRQNRIRGIVTRIRRRCGIGFRRWVVVVELNGRYNRRADQSAYRLGRGHQLHLERFQRVKATKRSVSTHGMLPTF